MAFKVKIDNVEYDLKDNFTIKEELNETLDSATIQFNTYGQEAKFESFDVAQIYDSEDAITKKHFLVDSVDDEIHSFGSSFETDDHLYTVSLFSETKLLERITLPNCSVTQPLTGRKKMVSEEILRFRTMYSPLVKVYSPNAQYKYNYQYQFSIDPALLERFYEIECPEFQWNNPTLREVLNDLLSTDDCIVVLREGVISFYDLKQRGNPIDVSKLSFSKKTMSSQDYAGELTIDMQNAIGKESTLVCEGITLRAPEGEGSLTTINGVLKTQSPIYAIKRLRVKVPISVYALEGRDWVNHTTFGYVWIDITDRVLEKEEFDLLSNVQIGTSMYDNLESYTDATGTTTKRHKVNFLYYKRGGNQILNVGTNYTERLGVAVTKQTFFGYYAIRAIADHLGYLPRPQDPPREWPYIGIKDITNTYNSGTDESDNDPRNLQFYIEYETVAEHALKVGKYLPIKHPENRVFDNQSNSYVDQEHMSIFEYAKVNRLGHKIRNIAGDYYNESEIPQLGDYIGDEILFSREITYQDNMLKFKGMLCPNYVLRDFFTGVRAKKRSWQIAKNEDALTRHDVYKLYVEASFSQKAYKFSTSIMGGIINIGGDEILARLIPINWTNRPPYYRLQALVQTLSPNGDGYYPDDEHGVIVDTQCTILGRSFCIDFGFNDNYKSAEYIVSDGTELTQAFYPYADKNGEFRYEYIFIYQKQEKSGSDSGITTLPTESDLLDEIRAGYELPKLRTDEYSGLSHDFVIKVNKDNREIIRHTLQFEYCSDTKDIIITDKFIKKITVVDRRTHSATDFFVYTSTDTYDKNDTQVKGTPCSDAVINRRLENALNLKINILDSHDDDYPIPAGTKSWAIVDENGDLLLAVNLPANATVMECWFNLLRSRDDKIYSDTYNGIVVGDLTPTGQANIDANYNALTTRASSSVRIQRRNVIRSQNDEN